jgi:hypothetical protein
MTPAKKQYQALKTVPARMNAKLEKENRCIKNELELVQLKLAETRLQMAEVRLRSREFGVSSYTQVIWVSSACVRIGRYANGFCAGYHIHRFPGAACFLVRPLCGP